MKLRDSIGVVLLLLSCTGPPKEDIKLGSSDVRIDGAGESDTVDSLGARMCVAEHGAVFVVWADNRDNTYDIWLARSLDEGQSWDVPVKVNVGDGNARWPDVACTPQRVYVVWEDDRDGQIENPNVYLNWSDDDGETWQPIDRNLDQDPQGFTRSLGPRIAAAGDDVYVVWYDSINGAFDIFVAASTTRGNTFEAPVRVDSGEPGEAYSAFPKLAADESGRVLVVWEDARNEKSDIYAAVSVDRAASFGTDFRLDGGDPAGNADSFAPRIAIDGDQAAVVWHDERGGVYRDVYLNWSSNFGSTWQSTDLRVDSDNPGFFDSLYPTVSIAGGVVHVAWQDARDEGYDIYYRAMQGGSFLAEEVRLDTGDLAGFGNSLNPIITTRGADVVVAWEDRRADIENEGYNDLYYNLSTDAGASFGGEDLRIDSVEEGVKFTRDLNAVVRGDFLLSAWVDGRSGNADVYFHRLALGEEAEFIQLESTEDESDG